MTSPRHGCAILAVGSCLMAASIAQEAKEEGEAAAPKKGASSAFGSSAKSDGGTAPGGATPGGTTPGGAQPGGATPGGSSAFGAPSKPAPAIPGTGPAAQPGAVPRETEEPGAGPQTGSRLRPGTGTPGTGAASAFGEGEDETAPKPTGNEPSYTIPGGYGRPAQQFTAGQGRLARPRFRYNGSVMFGYDDNVFLAPSNSQGTPDVVVEVADTPGTPPREESGIGPDGSTTTVVVPGSAPTTRRVVIPGIPGPKRVGSFLTRGNVGFDVQFASRKSLFTFDLRTGADWYWDRPGKDVDYTGSLALLYLRRLTPRLQFTANTNISYQTQPDLSQANTLTRQVGNLLNTSAKLDLTYRFSPRLSALVSMNYGSLRFQQTAFQLGDFDSFTVSSEVRYLYSPNLTMLGEVRYSMTTFPDFPERDSTAVFGLVGVELTFSRRLSASLRGGVAQRTFDESGVSATAPYAETTLSYQLAKATLIQFNGRFGFEEPPDAQSKLISLRVGLNLVQSFSPRLRGTLGANLVRQTTTNLLTEDEQILTAIDSTIGFEYNVNRHWTLNANYSYQRNSGSNSANDFFRNRAFVGAEYNF